MALNVTFDREGIPHAVAEQFDHIIAVIQTAFNKQLDTSALTSSELAAATAATAASIAGLAGQVPTGLIAPFGGSTAPAGWLLCNGSLYATSAQSDLFAVIGYTYGGGGENFAVPDLQQRFPLGKAASGTGSTLGGTGGAIDHTHTTPNHQHDVTGSTENATATISGETANESSHTHGVSITTDDGSNSVVTLTAGGASTASKFDHTHSVSGNTGSGSAHKHSKGTLAVDNHQHTAGTLATDSSGSGTSGSENPPFLAVNFIIKT